MDASIAVSSRRGHRLVSAVLGTVLAGAAALAAAQIVAVPAALLSHAEGGVAIAPKGDNEWMDVKPRRALKRGDRVWTDKGSRAEVQAGTHALRLDGQTQVGLESMGDGAGTQVSLLRGSLALAVPRLAAGENVEVGTPNLALRAKVPGDYRVDVDPQQGTTRVSVMGGAVAVYGEHGETQEIAAGQRFTFRDRSLARAPTPAFTAVDEFDRWIVARGRMPAAPAAQAAPSVHPDVIARMHREQEAQRMAQARRELEEQKQAQARQAAQPQRQQPAAAPVQAPPAAAVAAPRPVEAAPRIVQVPRAQPDAHAIAAARQAEEERQAQARRAQEQQRAAQARRQEDERRAVQARRAEDERRASQARKAEQDKRLAAAKRAEEDKRALQARRAQEQQRLAVAAKRAEEERRAALARKAEQDKQRLAAAKRQQQVQAQGEARRRGEHLARLQEQARREELAAREQRARREEQARREEEARREEQARREDETRREAWDRRQRALAEQQRRDQEVWLRTQQPMPVPPARPVPQGVPGRRVS